MERINVLDLLGAGAVEAKNNKRSHKTLTHYADIFIRAAARVEPAALGAECRCPDYSAGSQASSFTLLPRERHHNQCQTHSAKRQREPHTSLSHWKRNGSSVLLQGHLLYTCVHRRNANFRVGQDLTKLYHSKPASPQL